LGNRGKNRGPVQSPGRRTGPAASEAGLLGEKRSPTCTQGRSLGGYKLLPRPVETAPATLTSCIETPCSAAWLAVLATGVWRTDCNSTASGAAEVRHRLTLACELMCEVMDWDQILLGGHAFMQAIACMRSGHTCGVRSRKTRARVPRRLSGAIASRSLVSLSAAPCLHLHSHACPCSQRPARGGGMQRFAHPAAACPPSKLTPAAPGPLTA
jgi:hypothetical protein